MTNNFYTSDSNSSSVPNYFFVFNDLTSPADHYVRNPNVYHDFNSCLSVSFAISNKYPDKFRFSNFKLYEVN